MLLAWQNNTLSTQEAAAALDHCLLCRACHTACPAGVRPAKLVLALRRKVTPSTSLFGILLHTICCSVRFSAWTSYAIRRYQRSGLRALVRHPTLRRLFGFLARLDGWIPQERPEIHPVPEPAPGPLTPFVSLPPRATEVDDAPHTTAAPPKTVGMLSGCMARIFFPSVAPSAVKLITSLGFKTQILMAFGCCGAPFRESGDQNAFLRQARRTVDVFKAAGPLEAVVCDSTACAVTVRSYARALAHDPLYADAAKTLSAQTTAFSPFFADHMACHASPLPPQPESHSPTSRTLPALHTPESDRLIYHNHCQAYHGLGIMKGPEVLLAARSASPCEQSDAQGDAVPSIESECCGAGGEYMLRYPDRSRKILQSTLATIQESGSGVVAGENPGCLLAIASGLERTGSPVSVRHLVDVLWEAYGSSLMRR